MHGETRGSARRYYRCSTPRNYPSTPHEHPRSTYVREEALVAAIDQWIGELFTPERLPDTARLLADAARGDRSDHDIITRAQQRLSAARRELSQCRAALRAGGDPATLTTWINDAAQEERAAQVDLDASLSQYSPELTVAEIEALVTDLGGLARVLDQADPVDRAALYEALGINALYDAASNTATLHVEPAWGQRCVGGGT